jgi:hypothetical protein
MTAHGRLGAGAEPPGRRRLRCTGYILLPYVYSERADRSQATFRSRGRPGPRFATPFVDVVSCFFD